MDTFYFSLTSFIFLFIIDSSHSLFQGLLPDINTEINICSYRALEEKYFLHPLFRTHDKGLCFLGESLICSKSQRLVSRRNIVPILQETFFILDEDRDGFGGFGPVLNSRKQQTPGISFGKLSGSSSRERGINVKLSSRFSNLRKNVNNVTKTAEEMGLHE